MIIITFGPIYIYMSLIYFYIYISIYMYISNDNVYIYNSYKTYLIFFKKLAIYNNLQRILIALRKITDN